jgi:hypothetical protein
MLLDKVKHLEGKEIIFSKIRYKILELKNVSGWLVIKTDKRTFNFYPAEIDDWLSAIEVVDIEKEKETVSDKLYQETITKYTPDLPQLPVASLAAKEHVKAIPAEIISTNSVTGKVADKLFEMFEILSGEPSESNYKQAKAMVEMSNAIVNTQLAQLKFITLKKQ